MRRERMSRPRLSVPRRKFASAPLRQKGGSKEERRSCSSGSWGARRGAASATITSSSSTARPKRTRPLLSAAPSALRSTMTDPGIEQDVGHVDDEIERDEEHGEGEDEPLDERQVAVDDGADRHIADAGIAEDALDQHGAADDEGELHAAQGD